METSGVHTIASIYGMRAEAVHVASDNPVAEKSFFHHIPGKEGRRRRASEDLFVEALVRLIKRI